MVSMPQLITEHGGSSSSQDPVGCEPPKLGSDIFTKTKMCKFNLIGVCIKGSACMFAHDPEELKPVPDLFRTKICKTLINTGSCHNPDCRYAHNKDELRAAAVLAKPKPPRKPPQQPPAQRPMSFQRPAQRATMLTPAVPLAPMDGFGIPLLPASQDFAGLRPVGQIVPVPVAMPVGLVAWPGQPGLAGEGEPQWKPAKPKATAAGTRRGRRGKGQRSDSHLQIPDGRVTSPQGARDQEDSPMDDKMPDSFSTQTTATSSSGSAGRQRSSGALGNGNGDESSHDSSSDADLQLVAHRANACAQEVMQEGFDTDEELLFGSHDLQYHAEPELAEFAGGPRGGVMVKNTFLEFEHAPPPVLKKVHTAAGRLQELDAAEDVRRHR